MTADRRVLVCYDCADDYRRNKVSRTLLDYGTRIQESVFECIVEPALLEQMVERIRKLTDGWPEDRVCIVELCSNCAGRVLTMGSSPRATAAHSTVV